MNLSISNIAWSSDNDDEMYSFLQKIGGFAGLEIAPTRIFPEVPYEKLSQAKTLEINLREEYGLSISSIQSIWFGRSERIFGSVEERKTLLDYTKKAIVFAEVIHCNNLVFGCPKNRASSFDSDMNIAVSFFSELGEYAKMHHTVLAIEPNPALYGTNFINTTQEAFDLVNVVNCEGFKINVDFGTILYNNENLKTIEDNMNMVNHIHVSEPNLEVIKERDTHCQLNEILKKKSYQGFVSIEMRKQDNLNTVKSVMQYIKEVFK